MLCHCLSTYESLPVPCVENLPLQQDIVDGVPFGHGEVGKCDQAFESEDGRNMSKHISRLPQRSNAMRHHPELDLLLRFRRKIENSNHSTPNLPDKCDNSQPILALAPGKRFAAKFGRFPFEERGRGHGRSNSRARSMCCSCSALQCPSRGVRALLCGRAVRHRTGGMDIVATEQTCRAKCCVSVCHVCCDT